MGARIALVIAFTIIATGTTLARDQLKPTPPMDGDNACANAAAAFVSHVPDPKIAELVKLCNANPNKGICREAKLMIEQAVPQKDMPPWPRITCD